MQPRRPFPKSSRRCFDVHDAGWSLVKKRGTKKALQERDFWCENRVFRQFLEAQRLFQKSAFGSQLKSQENAGSKTSRFLPLPCLQHCKTVGAAAVPEHSVSIRSVTTICKMSLRFF